MLLSLELQGWLLEEQSMFLIKEAETQYQFKTYCCLIPTLLTLVKSYWENSSVKITQWMRQWEVRFWKPWTVSLKSTCTSIMHTMCHIKYFLHSIATLRPVKTQNMESEASSKLKMCNAKIHHFLKFVTTRFKYQFTILHVLGSYSAVYFGVTSTNNIFFA